MSSGRRTKTPRNQIETADAGKGNIDVREAVPRRQRIVRAELVIRPRIDAPPALRNPEHVREGIDDAQRDRIKRRAVDDGAIVHRVAPEIEKERRALAHRTTQVPAVLLQQKRRLLLRVWITGIPEVVREVEGLRAMKLIGSWPGQYLDTAGAQPVVFRRERILIDSDLADRLFRWSLAATESIDKDRCATRPGARTSNSDQFGDEIIWIVRERLQIVAAKHRRTGVVRRFGSHSGSTILDRYLLHDPDQFQPKIQCLNPRPNHNFHRLGRQIRCGSLHSVVAGNYTGDGIRSVICCGGRLWASPGSGERYLCAGYDRARFISDHTA